MVGKNITSKGSIALRAGRLRRRCFGRYVKEDKGDKNGN